MRRTTRLIFGARSASAHAQHEAAERLRALGYEVTEIISPNGIRLVDTNAPRARAIDEKRRAQRATRLDGGVR